MSRINETGERGHRNNEGSDSSFRENMSPYVMGDREMQREKREQNIANTRALEEDGTLPGLTIDDSAGYGRDGDFGSGDNAIGYATPAPDRGSADTPSSSKLPDGAIKKMDKDGDGQVSKAESEDFYKQFAYADSSDKKKGFTSEELSKALGDPGLAKEVMQMMDKNGNGHLGHGEWKKFFKGEGDDQSGGKYGGQGDGKGGDDQSGGKYGGQGGGKGGDDQSGGKYGGQGGDNQGSGKHGGNGNGGDNQGGGKHGDGNNGGYGDDNGKQQGGHNANPSDDSAGGNLPDGALKKMDSNGDGSVSKEESEEFYKQFAYADGSDKKKGFTLEELSKALGDPDLAKEVMKLMDKNGNEHLGHGEWKKFFKQGAGSPGGQEEEQGHEHTYH